MRANPARVNSVKAARTEMVSRESTGIGLTGQAARWISLINWMRQASMARVVCVAHLTPFPHVTDDGVVFHHDGPFDALNPHRNRPGRRAPMQAFPKDSVNMSLGGSGPLNKAPDHATFMGNHDDEAFRDWASSKKGRNGASSTEVPIFDPVSRGEVVHGDESVGLGTSTFLEGTPAARAAIAQQAQEEATLGLQRKKSLAQRIRPFKGSREYGHPNRMRSPDGIQSAGLQSTGSGASEANPFFNEYSKGEESISVRRDGALSPTSPPAPRRGSAGVPLERRVTTDATPASEEAVAPKPTGFIGRMKSLKGPRRPKNVEPQLAEDPPSYPGTAV